MVFNYFVRSCKLKYNKKPRSDYGEFQSSCKGEKTILSKRHFCRSIIKTLSLHLPYEDAINICCLLFL